MRWIILVLIFTCSSACSQDNRNIVIITADGLRWQEVFKGMDPAIASDNRFHEGDSAYIFQKYWSDTAGVRRKKLMPFLWNTIGAQGQLYGNRQFGNKVDNANPYWFSYPGYSELMTGFVDTAINSNGHPANSNENVLAFLNRQPALHGKVAAFAAWYAFDRILNEEKSGFPVINAFDTLGGSKPNPRERLINAMLRDSYRPWLEDECLDVFTHFGAMEWLKTRKPRVLYISYGETDEWAHSGKYRSYLDAARKVDDWIHEIWEYLQSDPFYRNKTTILITTDHGRGDSRKEEWTSHGKQVDGAGQVWLAVMGPGTPAKGEMKENTQLYLQQCAQTIARLVNYNFSTNHPVAEYIKTVFKP